MDKNRPIRLLSGHTGWIQTLNLTVSIR